MLIARVLGSAVATAKDPSLSGHRLQLVQQTDAAGEPNGEVFVAVDGAGAGSGELVLIATGSAARHGSNSAGKPIDALIVGIIDSMDIDGVDVFRKY